MDFISIGAKLQDSRKGLILGVTNSAKRRGKNETHYYERKDVYDIIRKLAIPGRAEEVINYLDSSYSIRSFGDVLPIEAVVNAVVNRYTGNFRTAKSSK